MENILDTLQQEPLPYTCVPFAFSRRADLRGIKVTFERWRVLLPPPLVLVWNASAPPAAPATAPMAWGWHVTVTRAEATPEELVFYTDTELLFWWNHGGPYVPLGKAPLSEWMAGRMLDTIMQGWPPEVLANEMLADDLRHIQGGLRRFYSVAVGCVREQRAEQESNP